MLGGTGAIGEPLVRRLSEKHSVYVTSRTKKENAGNITYICSNAKDDSFLFSLLERQQKYDVIIDFMVYKTEELKKRLQVILDNTEQYVFFSSSRCYAKSSLPIKEDFPRLIDVCKDAEYIESDEYGIAKGREENLLFESNKRNWTIIRPYITYNTYRLQLGVYEKEHWLNRALAGKTIIFPNDIAAKKTSLTYGPDVAGAIEDLIGNEKALGEAFHITTNESYTWGEILDFYCLEIERITGKRPKVKYIENSIGLQSVWNKWQIKYDRLFDREFDNSKIEAVRGVYSYKPIFQGLRECLESFIAEPRWLGRNIAFEAWCDRQCGEWVSLKSIPGKYNKYQYLKRRVLG